MTTVWFLTHPEVVVDPVVPVANWGLSEVGRARAAALTDTVVFAGVLSIWSSTETKARQTAALAGPSGAPRFELSQLGENDRTATGFVPSREFERLADAFFAEPTHSVRGWATAVDEQARIVTAVDRVLGDPQTGDGDVLIVSHGAVGTLLWCALTGQPITRAHDQPHQGCWFSFDRETRRPVAGWRPLETLLGR